MDLIAEAQAKKSWQYNRANTREKIMATEQFKKLKLFTRKEIQELLGLDESVTNQALKGMFRDGLLTFEIIDDKGTKGYKALPKPVHVNPTFWRRRAKLKRYPFESEFSPVYF